VGIVSIRKAGRKTVSGGGKNDVRSMSYTRRENRENPAIMYWEKTKRSLARGEQPVPEKERWGSPSSRNQRGGGGKRNLLGRKVQKIPLIRERRKLFKKERISFFKE